MKKQLYCISATNRQTKCRESITIPMSEVMALDWKPSVLDKKMYLYFRIAKHPFKPKKL